MCGDGSARLCIKLDSRTKPFFNDDARAVRVNVDGFSLFELIFCLNLWFSLDCECPDCVFVISTCSEENLRGLVRVLVSTDSTSSRKVGLPIYIVITIYLSAEYFVFANSEPEKFSYTEQIRY